MREWFGKTGAAFFAALLGISLLVSSAVSARDLVFETDRYRIILDSDAGLEFRSVFNGATDAEYLAQSKWARLFAIAVEGQLVPGEDWQVSGIRHQTLRRRSGQESDLRVHLLGMGPADGLRVTVVFSNQQSAISGQHAQRSTTNDRRASLSYRLRVENVGTQPRKIKVTTPALGGLRFSDDPDRTWYMYPNEGGIVSNLPIDIQVVRAHNFIPLMVAYAPSTSLRAGPGRGGLFVMYKDSKAEHFPACDFRKAVAGRPLPHLGTSEKVYNPVFGFDNGVGMAVHYLEETLRPGESLEFPETEIGFIRTDWREAMEHYMAWVKTWYRRVPGWEDREWFRRSFSWAGASPYKDGRYDFLGGLARETEVGSEAASDIISVANWWQWSYTDAFGKNPRPERWNPQNRGDYYYFEENGGQEAFRQAVEEAHRAGLKVSLYMEGMLVAKECDIGRTHGKEWAMMFEDGRYVDYYCNENEQHYSMCPSVPEWQDYLAKTVARLVRDTGVDAIYLDSIGMQSTACYNPLHHHRPRDWYHGVAQLYQKVREAVNAVDPHVAIWSEDVSCDVLTQYIDGSLTYDVQGRQFFRSIGADLSPTATCLFRFYFPHFKLFSWPERFHWDVDAFRLAFFNGEGACGIKSMLRSGFGRVWYENEDAFTSPTPAPFVETLVPGVYANRFPAATSDQRSAVSNQQTPIPGKVVYTLCNANPWPVEGEVVEVPLSGIGHPASGIRYYDLFRHEEVPSRRRGSREVLSLRLESAGQLGDVVAIAGLPRLLSVSAVSGQRSAISIRVSPRPERDAKLNVYLSGEGDPELIWSGRIGGAQPLQVNLPEGSSKTRVVVALLKDGQLLDETSIGVPVAQKKKVLVVRDIPGVFDGSWEWTGDGWHVTRDGQEAIFRFPEPVRLEAGSRIIQPVLADEKTKMIAILPHVAERKNANDPPSVAIWGEWVPGSLGSMGSDHTVYMGPIPERDQVAVLSLPLDRVQAWCMDADCISFRSVGGTVQWGPTVLETPGWEWW